MSIINVDEYLGRIKYSGSRDPSLENLKKLCEQHAQNIAFDNLTLFGGPAKNSDLREIYRLIIKQKRGGFCYELNGLFGELLKELGYVVAFLNCSSYKGVRLDVFSPPFDHMALKVKLDGVVWIVDVAYGLDTFIHPKKFELLTEEVGIVGTRRFREMPGSDDEYIVEERVKTLCYVKEGKHVKKIDNKGVSKRFDGSGDWNILYKLSLKERKWEDFEVGWIENTQNKENFLLRNSILTMFSGNGRIALWGYKFIEREFKDQSTDLVRVTEIAHETPEELVSLQQFIKSKFGVEFNFKLDQLRSDFYRE